MSDNTTTKTRLAAIVASAAAVATLGAGFIAPAAMAADTTTADTTTTNTTATADASKVGTVGSISATGISELDPAVDNEITVTGKDFKGDGAKYGAYVFVIDRSLWEPGQTPSADRGENSPYAAVTWVQAADGKVPALPKLDQNGDFTAKLTIKKDTLKAGKEYIVGTFAAHQLSLTNRTLDHAIDVTLKGQSAVLTAEGVKDLDPSVKNTITVTGKHYTGYAAKYGAYVVVVDKDTWEPGKTPALPSRGDSASNPYAAMTWVQAADGKVPALPKLDQNGDFTAKLEIPANTLKAGKEYIVGTFAAHQLSLTNRELDRSVAITLKKADAPKPVTFADVDDSTPHKADIDWLASSEISTGWKEKDGTVTFRGRNAVVRQDMAAFLYRLAGSPEFDETKAANPFSDVDKDTPHYKEILWLASTKISTGWTAEDGTVTFRGNQTIKRQDMAAFLHRLADWKKADPKLGDEVSFTDVDGKTPHAEDIAWLSKTGVTTGWTDKNTGKTEFRGGSDVIRQDMAAFLHRLSANVLA